jgi:hypothetical protein
VTQIKAILVVTAVLALVLLPIALPFGTVSAQTSSYSISQVDHHIEVMYSGNVLIEDTIHVSGIVSDGFLIGLPYTYANYVLEAYAFDSNNVYQLNLGVQFPATTSAFYAAQVNFNGKIPSTFTVAFVLSNHLMSEQGAGFYTLAYPAYPGFTQNVGYCNVTLSFPESPSSITITKDDGVVSESSYSTSNLPAYTYSAGSAAIEVPTGTIQLTIISQFNRQITIDQSGTVTATDSYRVVNNSTLTLRSFSLGLPADASNVVVRDESGRALTVDLSLKTSDTLLANTTLSSFLITGQSVALTAQYNLPAAVIQNGHYVLGDFNLFPDFNYYVASATFTFVPPEGATIISPQLSALDSSSSLQRQPFQDILTITKQGISRLDYSLPLSNTVQFSYDYNPIWVSLRPTFWASLIAVIGCFAVVIVRRRKPKSEAEVVREEEEEPSEEIAEEPEHAESVVVTGARVSDENIKDFTDAYEDRKELMAELKSMDAKARKGKIPRRQYKVQRRAIEIRLDGIAKHTRKLKNMFRASSTAYADLMKQLDKAEVDLKEAEKDIGKLENQESKGEISLETYRRNLQGYQRQKDKAESTINGILLRLREKIR